MNGNSDFSKSTSHLSSIADVESQSAPRSASEERQRSAVPTASGSQARQRSTDPTESVSWTRRAPEVGRFLRQYAIFLILAVLILFFQSREPAFLRINNLLSVLQSVAVVALLGIGVTVTLAVDGFDLSVGSIAAFTLMLTSYAMVVLQFSGAQTVALALLTGAIIGLVNGLLIVCLRIPDLLATLGMMFLLAGLN
jgi:simple sugar transport system permease protein